MFNELLNLSFHPSLITYTLSFLALLTGSITDLKTREVPDWVNYGLIMSGVSLNLLFSIIYSNPAFIVNSIIGLAVFFGIAYIMFYAGQWGGGDSKMLMGIGAMIGVDVSRGMGAFLIGFFINALLAGAVYGILWSFYLGFKNRRKFAKEFRKISAGKNTVRIKKLLLLGLITALPAFFLFFKSGAAGIIILTFALVSVMTFYFWIAIKSVEQSSMYKFVEPAKLTEGDWIAKDVYAKNEYICGPKDLGIEKSQIRKLVALYKQGKVKKIMIKEGIPFVPSFFIAFLFTMFYGNALMLIFP